MSDNTTAGGPFDSTEGATLGNLFLLTSNRLLRRILDIGLIVPELVARKSGKVLFADREQLLHLSHSASFPRRPVLLELKSSAPLGADVLGASYIQTVHFPSATDLEEYLSKGYENVPDDLFFYCSKPELFRSGVSGPPIDFELPLKPDQDLLSQKYRSLDVLAGLLWFYLDHELASQQAYSFVLQLTSSKSSITRAESTLRMIEAGRDLGLDATTSSILACYLEVIASNEIRFGWDPLKILSALEEKVPPEIFQASLFEKWSGYSRAILKHEKELSELSDEKHIILRGILLHLLAPDEESITRMAARGDGPGDLVIQIARALAASRAGFSAMPAEKKVKNPGRYFLISDILAGLPIESSVEVTEADEQIIFQWRGEQVAQFVRQSSKPSDALDSDRADCIPTICSHLSQIPYVASVDDVSLPGGVRVSLVKSYLKHCPRHAEFLVRVSKHGIYFETLLLDILQYKSQEKKLTNTKKSDLLEYQTVGGRDFRFEFVPGESLKAVIRVSEGTVDAAALSDALDRLISTQEWMKKEAKK